MFASLCMANQARHIKTATKRLSDELWWNTKESRQLARLQVTTDEHAYLLVFTKDHWWIEASYD